MNEAGFSLPQGSIDMNALHDAAKLVDAANTEQKAIKAEEALAKAIAPQGLPEPEVEAAPDVAAEPPAAPPSNPDAPTE